MTISKVLSNTMVILTLVMSSTLATAGEGRYQAHWNGKSYLIVDTDNGHMWTYHGDSLLYNGRIDGDEFEPPEKAQIWQQQQGKWKKRN